MRTNWFIRLTIILVRNFRVLKQTKKGSHVVSLRLRALDRHAEVESVAGVVHHHHQAAEGPAGGPDSLQDGRRRRRRENASADRGGQHPVADVPGEGGLVAAAPSRDERDLPVAAQPRVSCHVGSCSACEYF